MMQGAHWVIRNRDQQKRVLDFIFQAPFPYTVKVGPVVPPHTSKQIRYAHSLCNALAAFHGVDPTQAKRDAKAAYGVLRASTSILTGDKSVRLLSFTEYTRDELSAFCTAMEAHMDTEGIPYTPSHDGSL